MWKDPVVEEVRAIREQIAAECDYDLHKIFEMQREVQRTWKGKTVRKEDLPSKLPAAVKPSE